MEKVFIRNISKICKSPLIPKYKIHRYDAKSYEARVYPYEWSYTKDHSYGYIEIKYANTCIKPFTPVKYCKHPAGALWLNGICETFISQNLDESELFEKFSTTSTMRSTSLALSLGMS